MALGVPILKHFRVIGDEMKINIGNVSELYSLIYIHIMTTVT